ncbi:MAG TPA: anaerobic sulfatase maturase [Bacteroidales bacterium]|jgi:uncharacterized protein|nr:anaerobic sulfatase maturase [Bacteroidales bacterium]
MGAAEDIISREFQIFIKPAGPCCNLNCSYCYYLNKADLFKEGNIPFIDENLLEVILKQQIEATTEPVIIFSWHGGEPLLAGIDFYKKAVSLQKKLCPAEKKIINGIQTNGTLLTAGWCEFLAEEHFVVGISLDGPERLHDRYRKRKDGTGTFRKVIDGFDLLVIHGLEPEILCVVNSINSGYPAEVYGFFKQLGATYLTFIPLVERSGNTVSGLSVQPEAFGKFLCSIFDEWLVHDVGNIKVQIFEEALRTAFNQDHTLCIFKPVCGGVPVIEHNGDFYSCDHYVNHENLIGNIRTSTIAGMLDGQRQRAFGRLKHDSLPSYCRECEVVDMCNGECPKNRFSITVDGKPGLNYLCMGYKRFFNHCRPFVDEVARAFNRKSDE